MEQRSRLFIYDRKEMAVLILLAVMVSIFAFTLGVHLGKKVGLSTAGQGGDTAPVATLSDQLPNRQELTEHGKGAPQAVDESLNQALHNEVGRTGIKIEVPRQVDLPNETRSANAGATNVEASNERRGAEKVSDSELASIPAALRPAPEGGFTLQVGSHPTLDEAKDQVDAIEALGFKPFLRTAAVKDKGTWFRIFMGGFPSKEAAEKAGSRFQSQHVIESFVVSKLEE